MALKNPDKVLVLVNLGSPDEPTPKAVGRYLREFLMDPQVIDRTFWLRALLVNAIIVPFRRSRSARAYQKIWTDKGSPLKIHTADLAREVQRELGPEWRVDWAMRYGSPSLQSLLQLLSNEQPKELVILPLYPQWAKSSTGTVVELVRRHLARLSGQTEVVSAFYEEESFLEAFVERIQNHWRGENDGHLLFSFHGLPERHMRETDPGPEGCLSRPGCCEKMTDRNQNCYRAQCYSTARGLAERLNAKAGQWSVSFQSRLGREPWIQPFTDVVMPELARAGHRRIVVACPAFVADCLETIEEIGIRAKQELAALNTEVVLVPSLNSEALWVKGVARGVSMREWRRQPLSV